MAPVLANDGKRGDGLAKDVALFGREVVATSAAAARPVGRLAVLVDAAGDDADGSTIAGFLGVS